MKPAPFGRRLLALTIDSVLSVLVAMLFTASSTPGLMAAVVFLVMYTFFTGLYGQTPGMRLMRIACLAWDPDTHTAQPIGILRAVLRTALLQLFVPAVFLDQRGRGWHDRATNAMVYTS